MIHLVAKVFFTVLIRLWPFFGNANVARAQNTFFKMSLIVVLVFWSSLEQLLSKQCGFQHRSEGEERGKNTPKYSLLTLLHRVDINLKKKTKDVFKEHYSLKCTTMKDFRLYIMLTVIVHMKTEVVFVFLN